MVKKIASLVFITFVFALGCKKQTEQQNQEEGDGTPPKMKFERLYYDFGSITEGEKVSFIFTFENSGGSNLIIKDAIASCGCTVPKYNKKPIAPGKQGSVEVVFDSRGRSGIQYKSIILKTNTPYGRKTLTIKANVVKNKK